MKAKKTRYSIFRYQLLPNESSYQTTLFQTPISKDELIEKKNDYFKTAITNEKNNYKGKGTRILAKVEYVNDQDILLKVGVEKSKEINKPDFKKETIKDYPNIDIYVDNRKNKQFLIIENNLDAFSDSITVMNMLKKAWGEKMSEYRLSLYIEQTFNENEFWDTIKFYEDRGITAIKFEFIKPNISDISGQIKKVLNVVGNDLNGHMINVDVTAPANGHLENIKEGNPIIESFLSYNKEGGGKPPLIKVKGIRSNIKTIKSEKTFEIDEFNGSSEDLIELFKAATK